MIFSLVIVIYLLLYVKNTEIKNPPNFFKGLIEVIKTNRLVDFIDSKFREPYLSKLNNSFNSYKSLIRTILDPKYEPIKEDIRSYIASIPKYLLIAFSLSIPIGDLWKFLTFQDCVCDGGGCCTLVDKFQASVFAFIIDSFLLIGILIIALPFLLFLLSPRMRTRYWKRFKECLLLSTSILSTSMKSLSKQSSISNNRKIEMSLFNQRKRQEFRERLEDSNIFRGIFYLFGIVFIGAGLVVMVSEFSTPTYVTPNSTNEYYDEEYYEEEYSPNPTPYRRKIRPPSAFPAWKGPRKGYENMYREYEQKRRNYEENRLEGKYDYYE